PQCLTFGRGLCDLHHVSSRLVECTRHCFDEQVVLALEMPVEAPFFQTYLLHHRSDAAAVPAALAERASGHGKNFFVVLRFVFGRVSHDFKEYDSTLISVKGKTHKVTTRKPQVGVPVQTGVALCAIELPVL